MGMLVRGEWKDEPHSAKSTGGAFVRPDSLFRDRIGEKGIYPAAAGHYRLYVAASCPWAHRTLVVRALKGLEKALPAYFAGDDNRTAGWEYADGGFAYLHQLYAKAKPDYTGRVTVPVLWDTETCSIVNNESSEIIRMLNSALDAFAARRLPDLYPEGLRAEIDAVNERVYRGLNNGVYRAGFAT